MNEARQQKIRHKVDKLLRENGIKDGPVDVEAVARRLNVEIRKIPAADDLSGFILKHTDGTAVIGVNSLHHPNRQRFTIGHEIGHFMLHEMDQVHVDKFVLKLRDNESSTGEKDEEIEANRFAAELLMPMEFLEHDITKFAQNGLLDDRRMSQLAKKYNVSVQAMTNRLIGLGFIYDGMMY